ncbi:MAG TPA: oligosaccharide flippase family protein, partial [Marmoricola sp.]
MSVPERYEETSRTDHHRAALSRSARGSGLNLLGAAVSAATNFLLTIAVTHGASKDVAGLLFAITSLFLMASSIGRLGTDTGLVYFIARARAEHDDRRVHGYVAAALRPVLVAAGVTVLLLLVSVPYLADVFSRDHHDLVVQYLIALAVLIPCAGIESVALAATRGLGTMRPNVLIEQIGRPLLQYAMVLAALATHRQELLAIAWGFCYAPAALAAWASWRRRLRGSTGGRATTGLGKEFWTFTAPRSVASIMQLALQRMDIVLVAVIAGPSPAAVYTAATRFVVVGQMGRNAVSLAVQPEMAQSLQRGDRRGTNMLYQATTGWLMLVTWPVYLTLCVEGDVVLRIFGHGYAEGAPVLLLVAGAMLVATLCGDVDIVLIMAARTSWSMINVTGAFVLNLTLDLLLIPHLGILGAAIGWAVAIAAKNLSALFQVAVAL